jgi:hypothetical protein
MSFTPEFLGILGNIVGLILVFLICGLGFIYLSGGLTVLVGKEKRDAIYSVVSGLGMMLVSIYVAIKIMDNMVGK